MPRMQSLFSTVIDPEEALPEFLQWYHDQGNAPGGYRVDEMPQKIKEMAEALERAGYLKYWPANAEWEAGRYRVKEELREELLIPYEWDKLFWSYIEDKLNKDWTYSEILNNFHWFTMNYYGINQEDTDLKFETEWKVQDKLLNRVPIEEVVEDCFQGGVETQLRGIKNINQIIDNLVEASTEEEVDKILDRPIKRTFHGENETIKFTYGLAYKIAFTILTDKEKIKEILGKHMPGMEWVHNELH